uniref:Putative secreted protein n=1 Tax=Panstrongylus lignarius TaxID=156445 RepID=A0A224Y068_9HEMI
MAPVVVNILFLLILCTQQLSRADIVLNVIMVSPIAKKTKVSFHNVGKTLGSVANPSIANIAQLLAPFSRVQRLNTPTEGALKETSVPFTYPILCGPISHFGVSNADSTARVATIVNNTHIKLMDVTIT